MKDDIIDFLDSKKGQTIASIISGVGLSLIVFFIIYGLSSKNYIAISNASFACFAIMLTFAFFSFGNSKGYFNSTIYGFSYLFGSLGRMYRAKYGNDFSEFSNNKKEKDTSTKSYNFLVYLIICLPYLITGIIFFTII